MHRPRGRQRRSEGCFSHNGSTYRLETVRWESLWCCCHLPTWQGRCTWATPWPTPSRMLLFDGTDTLVPYVHVCAVCTHWRSLFLFSSGLQATTKYCKIRHTLSPSPLLHKPIYYCTMEPLISVHLKNILNKNCDKWGVVSHQDGLSCMLLIQVCTLST